MPKKKGGEETVNVTLRLPREVHEALVTLATTDRRSLNGEIVHLLEKAIRMASEPTN